MSFTNSLSERFVPKERVLGLGPALLVFSPYLVKIFFISASEERRENFSVFMASEQRRNIRVNTAFINHLSQISVPLLWIIFQTHPFIPFNDAVINNRFERLKVASRVGLSQRRAITIFVFLFHFN